MPMTPLQKANYGMMRLMVRVMPSCKDISALISRGMDQQLPLHKRLSIRLHVSICKFCRRYEKQLHLIQEGVGHYANPDENAVTKALSTEAKVRLQQALEHHGH